MALGSVVEHMHPIAGKAPDDEVYRQGRESVQADQELFAKRLAANV
jgi:hypothetical protein